MLLFFCIKFFLLDVAKIWCYDRSIMKEINLENHQCFICNQICLNQNEVGKHTSQKHKISSKNYILKHFYNDIVPLCSCGCGSETDWNQTKYNFKDFKSGHNKIKITTSNVREVDFTNYSCLICEYFCKNRGSLGNHLMRSHKEFTTETYTLQYHFDNKIPLCLCGCGEQVSYHKLLYKYNDYITGHNDNRNRFTTSNQPPPKTPAQQQKNNESVRKAYSGENGIKIRKKISNSLKETYNVKPSYRMDISRTSLRSWANNPERREKASVLAMLLQKQGKIGPNAPFKIEDKFNPFTNQIEKMDSSYETRFLDCCIKINYPVTKEHEIRIPYIKPKDGLYHKYNPDFLSLKENKIFETKGRNNEDAVAKAEYAFKWAEKNNFTYEVIFLEDLEALEKETQKLEEKNNENK